MMSNGTLENFFVWNSPVRSDLLRTMSVLSFLILLLWILPETGYSDSDVQFMGYSHRLDTWLKAQVVLEETFSKGEFASAWEDPNFIPLFWHPCVFEQLYIYERWLFGLCHDSQFVRGNIWTWKPASPKHVMRHWSPENMCRLMNGRNIAFIGDSMSWQMGLTLVSAMYRDLFIPDAYINDTEYINNKRARLAWHCNYFCPSDQDCTQDPIDVDCGALPNFKISILRDNELDPAGDWSQRIKSHNVTLAVINTGAHFPPSIIKNVDETVSVLHGMNISVVFRTTTPGHPFCTPYQHAKPLNASEVAVFNFTNKANNYRYDEMIPQTLEVVEMLRRKHPSVLVVNIHNATSRRVDSHPLNQGDCLHYCMPGPINEWIRFLYHALATVSGNDSDAAADATSHHHHHYHDPSIRHEGYKRTVGHFTLPMHVNTNLPSTAYVAFGSSKKYSIGGTSLFLWQNGTRHRVAPDSVPKSEIKVLDVWEFSDLPPGRPMYELD